MRKTLTTRNTTKPVMAAVTALFLALPAAAFAQGTGPQGSGPHGPGMMQGGTPGAGMPGGRMHGGDMPRTARHAERFMILYDLNKDGKVTIDEINEDQARIFTAMDVDNDKSMSVEEIRRRGRSLQTFRTTTLFDLLDADGDGKLSLAEIQAPSKRWFKRYDANGDGVMEASEVPSRRGGSKGRRHGGR